MLEKRKVSAHAFSTRDTMSFGLLGLYITMVYTRVTIVCPSGETTCRTTVKHWAAAGNMPDNSTGMTGNSTCMIERKVTCGEHRVQWRVCMMFFCQCVYTSRYTTRPGLKCSCSLGAVQTKNLLLCLGIQKSPATMPGHCYAVVKMVWVVVRLFCVVWSLLLFHVKMIFSVVSRNSSSWCFPLYNGWKSSIWCLGKW